MRKKLYKSGKQWVVAAATAVIVGGVVIPAPLNVLQMNVVTAAEVAPGVSDTITNPGTNYKAVTANTKFSAQYQLSPGDITASLRSALNRAASNAGNTLIYLPAGKYTVGSGYSYPLNSNVTIVAESGTTVTKTAGSTNLFSKPMTTSDNINIYGGTWDANNLAGNVVEVGDSTVTVTNATLANSAKDAVRVAGGNVTSNNVKITNPGSSAVFADSGASVKADGVTVTGSGYHGIYLNDASGSLSNVDVSTSANNGLWLSGSKVTLNGINAHDNTQSGIFADDQSVITSSDITVENNGYQGLYVRNSQMTATHLTATGNTNNGVWLASQDSDGGVTDAKLPTFTAANRDSISNSSYTPAGTTLTATNVTVSDNQQNGIRLDNAKGTLTSITGSGNTLDGLSSGNGSVSILSGATFTGNHNDGVGIENSRLDASTGTNVFSKNDERGVSLTQTSSANLVGAQLENNGQNPVQGDDGADGHGLGVTEGAIATVDNSTLSGNHDTGISVFGGGYANVSNTTIDSNGRHGIGARQQVTLALSSDTITANGQVYPNYANGVLLSDRSEITKMTDNNISNNIGAGLSVNDASKTSTLTNNTFDSNGSHNVAVSTGSANEPGSTVVIGDGNQLENAGAQGISAIGAANTLKIATSTKATTISGSQNNGIWVNGVNFELSGSKLVVDGNKENGIALQSLGNQPNLSNTTITNNGKVGLNVASSKLANVNSNTIVGNATNGIHLNNSDATSIDKNTLQDNGSRGIWIEGTSTVADVSGNTITGYSYKPIDVKSPADVTVGSNTTSSTTPKQTFLDVPTSNGFYNAIEWLAGQGITAGYAATGGREYRPNAPVPREQMARFLYVFAGQPAYTITTADQNEFKDITSKSNFAKEIYWLASTKITVGNKGNFLPKQHVTRGQMARFLYVFAGQPAFTPTATQKAQFSDINANTPFAKEIYWLASEKITVGNKGKFNPDAAVTRGQMAQFLKVFNDNVMAVGTFK